MLQSLFLLTIIYEKIIQKTIKNSINNIVNEKNYNRYLIMNELLIAIKKILYINFLSFEKTIIIASNSLKSKLIKNKSTITCEI